MDSYIQCNLLDNEEVEQLNKYHMDNGQNETNLIGATELAVIAATITTIGDALAMLSAILALKEEAQQQNDQKDQEKRMLNMQKQIDYLTLELTKMKKSKC